MKRLTALLVLCPFLLVAGFAGSARATSPTSEPVDQTFDFVDPTLCSFPVHVQVTYVGNFVTFYDRLMFTHVRLPGGGIFLGSVGRVVLDIFGNVVSFHGMPTTAPPAQHDAFCAALT